MNGLQALLITLTLIVIVFTPIVFLIKYMLKKEEKKRRNIIDNIIETWKNKFKLENIDFFEFDNRYTITNAQVNAICRSYQHNNISDIQNINIFYNKLYEKGLYKNKLMKLFGKDKGMQYFTNGFELGLTKIDIINSLGQPKDYKKETLKTKVKETLYYSYTKSDNFYVFDNQVLVKIVN